jgi:hypothetical protein
MNPLIPIALQAAAELVAMLRRENRPPTAEEVAELDRRIAEARGSLLSKLETIANSGAD